MKVTIEEVHKIGENPYFVVSANEGESLRCFAFQEDKPADSTWNRERTFKDAIEYAHQLKSGLKEQRQTVLEL